MEEILQHINEIIALPETILNQMPFVPEFVKVSILKIIPLIPVLYILYYIIELLERFFLKRIHFFVRLIQNFGAIFGATIAQVPECGYSVLATSLYGRGMVSKGTLFAFFIACSDDALPLLLLDMSKIYVIIPIVLIKLVLAVVVAIGIDTFSLLSTGKFKVDDINSINTDIMDKGCCHHTITSVENPPYWWVHPLLHTFNVTIFALFGLLVINYAIQAQGSVDNVAALLLKDNPLQVVIFAAIGLIPNCAASIYVAVAYAMDLVSFPAFLAFLIATSGIAMNLMKKGLETRKEVPLFQIVLFILAIIVGFIASGTIPLLSDIFNIGI